MTGAAPKIAYPALRWRGGKWRIAPWIVGHLPGHECYVEPFAGAASVLLRKPPSPFECLNDVDGDMVAFWKVLRERSMEFIAQILTTPFSRAELYRALEPVPRNFRPPFDTVAAIEMEQARRLWVRCYQGRGSSSRKSGWRFQPSQMGKSRWNTHHPILAARVHGLVDVAFRLRLVQIEQTDWQDCIARWDKPGTLFYVDPPYPQEHRQHTRNLYAHEMDNAHHHLLAEQLHALQGMVIVSGYPGLYDCLFAGWRRVERIAYGERQKQVLECLWISPRADCLTIPCPIRGSDQGRT